VGLFGGPLVRLFGGDRTRVLGRVGSSERMTSMVASVNTAVWTSTVALWNPAPRAWNTVSAR
jgi:hypothetical protein